MTDKEDAVAEGVDAAPPVADDTPLEQTPVGDGEITALKQATAAAEQKLTGANSALAQAVASYKALVIATNPDVPAELLSGGTIDQVNESLKNARALVSRVRQAVEAEVSQTRVPAGAPQRTPPDLSGLSPREKIQYAIGGKK